MDKVTVAIGHRYDSRYLRNRAVPVAGFDAEFPVIPGKEDGHERFAAPGEPYMAPGPIFGRMAKDPPYDMGEQAFSTYLQAVDLGQEVTALPVFPSRFFPHLQICVGVHSNIRTPKDLEGKRFALSCYSVNFGIWLRGILRDQYGVDPAKIIWVTQRDEYYDFKPDARYTLVRAAKGKSMWKQLQAGEVDALVSPWADAQAAERGVRSLLPDPYADIAAYYKSSRVFPLNTIVMLPKRTLRDHPGLAEAVLRAYHGALELYEKDVRGGKLEDEYGGVELRALERAAGVFLPPYGLTDDNRRCIEAMLRYCRDEGIVTRALKPEDLFLPGSF